MIVLCDVEAQRLCKNPLKIISHKMFYDDFYKGALRASASLTRIENKIITTRINID